MRVRWAGSALVAAFAGLLFTAGPAGAHAVLAAATPAPGSVLAHGQSPSSVVITFDETVEVQPGAIQVLGASGARLDDGQPQHPSGDGHKVAVRLRPGLADGSYLVLWHVVSADSHPVHGSFTFAVGRPGSVAAITEPAPSPGLSLALGSTRFLSYACFFLLAGLIAVALVVDPGVTRSRRGTLLWRSAAGGCALATLVGLVLQACLDTGGRWSSIGDPTALQGLIATRFGHAQLIRSGVAAALAVLPMRQVRRLAVVAPGIAATFAVEGHAGRDLLTTAIDSAHLVAAGAWLGSLVVLFALVLSRPSTPPVQRPAVPDVAAADSRAAAPRLSAPTGPNQGLAVLEPSAPPVPVGALAVAPAPALRRFSLLAASSVAVLLGSGIAQSLRQIPSLGALTETTYGRELTVKVGLVGCALAVAGVSSRLVHRRADAAGRARRNRHLRRTVLAETALLAAALAVTSALVATTPAAVAYHPAQERTLTVGPDTLDVSALSPSARTLDLHVYCYGPDGAIGPVERLSGELVPPARSGLSPLTLPLVEAGTGHFVAAKLLLPATGNWSLRLTAQTGEFDAYTATTTLTIR